MHSFLNVLIVKFVDLKTLLHQEDKIKEVYLSAPAYIVNKNPLKVLFNVFISQENGTP